MQFVTIWKEGLDDSPLLLALMVHDLFKPLSSWDLIFLI
jgi:hypothetical protein